MKTAAINEKAADLKARVIAYCDERALQLGGLVARLKAGEALDEANAKELTTYCDQKQCLTLGGLVDEVWQLRVDYHNDAEAYASCPEDDDYAGLPNEDGINEDGQNVFHPGPY